MKKTYTFFILTIVASFFFSSSLYAQRTCAAHDKMLQQFIENPDMEKKSQELEDFTRQFIKNYTTTSLKATETRTIPVNVIVVYANSLQNISQAQIESQIAVLNNDFSGQNNDIDDVPGEFTPVTSYNTGVQFVLANVERHSNSRTSWGTNDDVKSSYPPTDPDTTLNMWVCNIGGGILGYAQFPGGNAATDGVVFSPQYCGSSDYDDGSFYLSPPFDKGRTATHEVGHYLNLRHIWGDGPCAFSDFVDDTPSASGPNYGCPTHPHVSCSSNDMFMNYMDYVDDDCMIMFSLGQEARMWATLNSTRQNLGTSGPIANPNGPYDGEPGVAVNFSSVGSSSPNGEIVSYHWDFGDDNTSTAAEPSHIYTDEDSYSVTLTVTDNIGKTDIGVTTATISTAGSNTPPIANTNGPYTGEPGTAISFSSAGSSDSDGTIDSYLWNFGDGNTSTSADPSHIYTLEGSYSVTLTVTDNEGATGTNVTTATISSGSTNIPPVSTPNGPYTGQVGSAISFSSAGINDPDGSIVSGFWDFGDGTTSTTANPTHVYSAEGVYTVELSVTDNDGATTVASTTATVTAVTGNLPPEPNANGPYTGDVGESINFSFAGTNDPDGNLASGFWDFGDGTTSTVPNPTHVYTSEGTYTVILSVTDNDGATATDETTATIGGGGNANPVANANGPYSAALGEAIGFSSLGSGDSDGTITAYLWNFGDGNTSSSADPSHTYTAGGIYTVSLTVTDNDGATNTDQTTATITGSTVPVVLSESYFETGWDGWTDGGVDAERYSGAFSYEGNYSILLRDNSGIASTMLSPFYDVTSYQELTIDFHFYAEGMEAGESFLVGYNNGSSWTAIGSYTSGSDFQNDQFSNVSITISRNDFNFPANARFAMQCSGSDNSDVIYIDQVIISASETATARSAKLALNAKFDLTNRLSEFRIYPIPVENTLTIHYEVDEDSKAEIYNVSGALIKTIKLVDDKTELLIGDLHPGVYVIKVSDKRGFDKQRKFIKR